jgi:hypothetical protein
MNPASTSRLIGILTLMSLCLLASSSDDSSPTGRPAPGILGSTRPTAG